MRHWIPLALAGCALLTSGCASQLPTLPAAPRLDMPAEATRPCELYLLPPDASEADLEVGFAQRGAQLAACDAARRLAVQTHDAEHALEDEARGKRRKAAGGSGG